MFSVRQYAGNGESRRFRQKKGALTIAMTFEPDSPLAKEAEYVAVYDWGENAQAINTNYGVLYQIVFGALHVLENHPAFEQAIDGLNKLQTVYDKALKQEADHAKAFAKAHEKKISFTRWQAVRTTASLTPTASAFSWKCNGFIPTPFMPENIFTDRSKSLMNPFHLLSCSA